MVCLRFLSARTNTSDWFKAEEMRLCCRTWHEMFDSVLYTASLSCPSKTKQGWSYTATQWRCTATLSREKEPVGLPNAIIMMLSLHFLIEEGEACCESRELWTIYLVDDLARRIRCIESQPAPMHLSGEVHADLLLVDVVVCLFHMVGHVFFVVGNLIE